MVKNCKFFECKRNNCHCINPIGATGHRECGCNNCLHQSFEGSGVYQIEICEIALSLREVEMEED